MIVIKEEFVGGEKWRRAAKLGRSDAIVMWLALKCYASQHPSSEGFVPDEDVDDLPGAPRGARKALQALVECGRRLPDGSRSSGLVDAVEGGWQLHDYLDHSATPEELELRRERARLKKQRQREEQRQQLEQLRAIGRDMSPGQAGDTGGQVPGGTAGTVPGESLGGARPPAAAPTRDPNPPQPSPPQPNLKQNPGSEIRDPRARGAGPGPIGRHPEDPGTRGHERQEPQQDHRRLAKKLGLNIDDALRKLGGDPRTKALSTPEFWRVLTRLLEKMGADQQRLGGAA